MSFVTVRSKAVIFDTGIILGQRSFGFLDNITNLFFFIIIINIRKRM